VPHKVYNKDQSSLKWWWELHICNIVIQNSIHKQRHPINMDYGVIYKGNTCTKLIHTNREW